MLGYIKNIVSLTQKMALSRCLSLFIGLLFVLLPNFLPQVNAARPADKILVVTSKTTGAYEKVIDVIKVTLKKNKVNKYDLLVITPDKFDKDQFSAKRNARPRLIVTVGTKAAKKVRDERVTVPVLNTLIPRSAFLSLHKNNKKNGYRKHSAIFIDQPLIRQINLIHIALPQRKRVGIILGPSSKHILKEIDVTKGVSKVRLMITIINEGENLIKVLNRLLEYTDVLLAVPDRAVFNRGTVHHFLLTTYRQNVPVIGYSKAYVNAGALLAVYSTPENIGLQTGELIRQLLRKREYRLPAPQFPKYFSVSINYQVARSMGISLESEAVIERKIRENEN